MGPGPIVAIVTAGVTACSWDQCLLVGRCSWEAVPEPREWPSPDGRPIQPGDSIPFLPPPSQTRWRPLQWPERPQREGLSESARKRWGRWRWGVSAFQKSLITAIVEIFSACFFLAFLIQNAPSQHALQALLRIPIKGQTDSHKTERNRRN